MKSILAIDIGTTSTKALLVRADGSLISSSQVFSTTLYPAWGQAEQNPIEILEGVKKLIKQAAFANTIDAVSVSCAMHSLIAVDKSGNPLTNAIIWSDIRSHAEAKELKNTAGDLTYLTGTPIHPMSPLCKLIWLRKNNRTVFDQAHKFVSIKEFIFYHLFGVWQVDYSMASATGLFDVHQLTWSSTALKLAGVDESKLSTAVSPSTICSGLSEQMAQSLGLASKTPFIIGASDGCLSNLGSNVMQPGQLALTIGTSGAVRMTSTHFQKDAKQTLFNYRLDEKHFVSGGATNNGSVVLDWFGKNMLNAKFSIDELISHGMKTAPGAEGLLFLPYVYGERSPFYNPNARGVFFGLAQHHTHAHMTRALIEGICFELKSIFSAVEETAGDVSEIKASGGFTQSIEWVQCLADILNKPITVTSSKDASAIGAARMGFRALDIPSEFGDDPSVVQCTPREKHRTLYAEYNALFTELTADVQQKFDKIASWQR